LEINKPNQGIKGDGKKPPRLMPGVETVEKVHNSFNGSKLYVKYTVIFDIE